MTTRDGVYGGFELAEAALAAARAAGAEEADLRLVETRETQITLRLGELELLRESEGRELGLRVWRGGRRALLRSTRLEKESLAGLAREALELAETAAPDLLQRLPEPECYATQDLDLDLRDAEAPWELEDALARVRELEAVALGADPRIVNNHGAHFSRRETRLLYATSNGFLREERESAFWLALQPVARDGDQSLVSAAWSRGARHLADLADPSEMGREAAQRVLRRLDPRSAPRGRFPVLFEPRLAARIIGRLFGCIAGDAVRRKRSYLAQRLGDAVAAPGFTLRDDPHIPRGLGSRSWDGEGLPGSSLDLIAAGRLCHFPTDLESARRLELPATGHGAWGGGVQPSNLYVLPGEASPEEILAGTPRGLLVIDMLGSGFNPTSGHWSQGCAGLWIESGEIAHPANELSIAANLDEVLTGIDAVGKDLDFSQGPICSPTLRTAAMTVSGG